MKDDEVVVIERLWLCPPMALARVGGSTTPCDNYAWGANDMHPLGSGKTTVVPQRTLKLDPRGTLTPASPEAVVFKDDAGFRPLCPYFELFGEWSAGGSRCQGQITQSLLARCKLTEADVEWEVTVANLKAYHYTQQRGDRVDASVTVRACDTVPHGLHGRSPADCDRPLVRRDTAIPMGTVQVPRLTTDFPECRLRFTPPPGLVYAPTNFNDRVDAIVKSGKTSRWNLDGTPFHLPPDQLRLNPDAVWVGWTPREKAYVTHRGHVDRDLRTMPVQTYASDDTRDGPPSMGLVDDMSDGFVRCRIRHLEAVARIVVAPPHFAPDRRPIVSLADGLTDRVQRAEVLDNAYYQGKDASDRERAQEQTTAEIRDLLERVLETQGLMNLDVLNESFLNRNRQTASDQSVRIPGLDTRLFPSLPSLATRPLPLTEAGRQRHRRILALEVVEDRVREDPTILDRLVRAPVPGDPYFDQKMPALMLGSDSHPMHLTRRQFDLLMEWVRRLRRGVRDLE